MLRILIKLKHMKVNLYIFLILKIHKNNKRYLLECLFDTIFISVTRI